jgi:hypothetical protein
MFIDYNLYINDILLGLFVGIGSALGNYLIQKSLIRRLDRLEGYEKLNRNSKEE